MTDWATIFPGLEPDPLRGVPAEYADAAAEARAVAETTAEAQSQFHLVRTGPLGQLRGQFAEAFVEVVGTLDEQLADLSPVFDALSSIFDHHAEELARLRTAAAEALARATTNWNQLAEAETGTQAALTALAAIESQIRRLRARDATPAVEAELRRQDTRRWHQLGEVEWWDGRVAQATADLDASHAEYDALVAAEAELIAVTVDGLRNVPLGALRDPSGLFAALGDLAGAAWGLVTDGAAAVGGLVAGAVTGLVNVLASIGPIGDLLEGLAVCAGWALDAVISALSEALAPVLFALAAVVLAVAVAAVIAVGVAALIVFCTMPVPLQAWVAARVDDIFRAISDRWFASSPGGDPGGTYEMAPIGRFDAAASLDAAALAPGMTPVPTGPLPASGPDDEVGRAAIIEAFAVIDEVDLDEFAIVDVGAGNYVVVLPGVTDLSSPDFGLNDHNATSRDTDVHALPSSTSTGLADNVYGQLVFGSLLANDIPPGSNLLIIGHSFGADTALDLAADPDVAATYNITHVVAAAYNSGPQLEHVIGDTNVLVLQNSRDLAVQFEAALYHPVGAVDGVFSAGGNLLDGNLVDAVRDLDRAAGHVGNVATDIADVRSGLNPLSDTMTAGVSQPRDGQVVAVFHGGLAGAGHHPSNYTDYLATHTHSAVAEFESSVGAAGYAAPGTIYTVDVSVPEDAAVAP